MAIAQSITGRSDVTMPGAITAGHLLIIVHGIRGLFLPDAHFLAQGYSQIPQGNAKAGNNDGCSIWFKTAGSSEPTTLTVSNTECFVAWIELDSNATLRDSDEATDPGGGLGWTNTPTTPPISADSGDFCIAVATEGTDGGWGHHSYTPPGGWTELVDNNHPTDHPTTWVGYKVSAGGSEHAAPVCDGTGYWSAQLAAFGPVAPPPTPGIDHDVYDPDDTLLGDLPSAFDVKVRIELDGTGSGSFKVRRDAPDATAEVLTPGNYVRVTVPQIDPDPISGFFLEGAPAPETPTIRLVSTDESGGEIATFGGRGGLAYWERAIWLAESFLINWWPPFIEAAHGAPSSTDIGAISFAAGTYSRYTVSGGHASSPIPFTTGGFSAYYDSRQPYTRTGLGPITLVQLHGGSHDNWYVHPFGPGVTDYKRTAHYRFGNSVLMESIDDGDKPGQILYAMFGESQAAGRPIHPVPLLTVDFDDTTDSDGNAWTVTDALKAISTELGDDYLSTIGKLVNTGAVDVYMDPDLGMHGYNQYGRDLHETVRFAKGLNIADVLDRVYTDQPTGTFAEVQGQSDGTIARVTVAGSPPREISVRGDSDDLAVLESLGEAELALRQLHSDTVAFNVATPIIGREDPDNGMYLPGPPGSAHGDYWVGDLVTLHTGTGEHDFDEQVVRIAAITLQLSESGDLRVTVEVISGFGGIPTLGSPSSSGPTAGGAGQPQTISDLYQLLSERDQPAGYAGLDADGHVFLAELGGLTWKNSVRVAATANVTLATLDAGDTLDGVTLAEGDEVLLPVQTDPSENGIWVVQDAGTAPTRRQDFDDSSEIVGAIVPVREGTANERTLWLVTNTTPPVIDTDDITIVQMVPDIDVSALNAAVFGYLAHGNTGASETFDASAAGWHSATLNSATVTVTFAGASGGSVASMVLELAQDGTGGRAVDFPASVVNGTALEASLSPAASATTYYVFFSHDGGVNWIGFVLGGSGSPASDSAVWLPLTSVVGGEPVLVWDGDDSLIPTLIPI